ncbi:TetR family transcriptional regulator [Mycolicibacterium brumae]|uniref:TetR family transcriptional regulator n=1 Tax=Mycolicibacterium brumae TaxID=85968 RepID=A0A2G5P595_9MYCO|nr:TetR family transcriptional regulator [Mycolicibacterium brumae]MCV7191731.1 TetR family transcriptional regulator [Mycolicibacterium brumae]PIB73290.1 TetR family transcriptional regulator [Mycolicibacterium brumae]RWA17959.1 hypothetical protein MBRU_18220 [Mycolicibacterium brumae DSM 44177]UWW08990.1 TetR family transcriptional regulator [Mycolicibacterium brumae]
MSTHKRDSHDRAGIVSTAVAILDAYGLADLTMRRLARELDVTAGALYWHFANKQELLGAVADQLLAPALSTDDGDWRDRVTAIAGRLRDALLSHTDGAELVSASFAAGQSRVLAELLGQLGRAAGDAGVREEHREAAARTVVYYVLGFTVDEQSRLQWDAAGALGEPVWNPAADTGAAFGFGLGLLIDGLDRQGAQPIVVERCERALAEPLGVQRADAGR